MSVAPHEKHAVATWVLGNISVLAFRQRETKKNLCRGGRSQDLLITSSGDVARPDKDSPHIMSSSVAHRPPNKGVEYFLMSKKESGPREQTKTFCMLFFGKGVPDSRRHRRSRVAGALSTPQIVACSFFKKVLIRYLSRRTGNNQQEAE
jgi:hypothetical protein